MTIRAISGRKSDPELSIVLVHYNDRVHLVPCLSSLQKAVSGLSAEVILVDNHSGDGSPGLVRKAFPWIRLIENSENLGYPKANNIGFRRSRGEFCLFLNTDTVMPETGLSVLLAKIRERPEFGAVGPALVHENGRFQVSFGGRVGFFSEIRQKFILNPFYKIALRISRKAREVGWLSGACLLARREAVEGAGLFDENFFLYFEDIDLCRRIKNRGFKLIFFPLVRVTHTGGGATSACPWPSRLAYRRSQLRFYEKHNSRNSRRFLRLYLRWIVFVLGLIGAGGESEERNRYRDGLRKLVSGRGREVN
ncbi:MAG: glycosyltransferase family 2 protein [Candidatus Aminicenantes bacterium]|nr:glycosyltransferase family 2 protein [Candidatus Aminicenantes bacterium]